MNKSEAMDSYLEGRTPTVAQLAGRWQVEMWGWWRVMSLDKKVISGSRGYSELPPLKSVSFLLRRGAEF